MEWLLSNQSVNHKIFEMASMAQPLKDHWMRNRIYVDHYEDVDVTT